VEKRWHSLFCGISGRARRLRKIRADVPAAEISSAHPHSSPSFPGLKKFPVDNHRSHPAKVPQQVKVAFLRIGGGAVREAKNRGLLREKTTASKRGIHSCFTRSLSEEMRRIRLLSLSCHIFANRPASPPTSTDCGMISVSSGGTVSSHPLVPRLA